MRTVVCEKAAEETIDACAIAFPRGRELCEAMIDLVSRMPSVGERLPGTNPPEFLVRSSEPLGEGTPTVTMHYRMDADETITIIKARYHDS